jgi:hypothetical protein
MLTAAPDASWLFDGWSEDCTSSGTDAACELAMTTTRAATATFSRDPNIFLDGFESGDTCAWSANAGGDSCPQPALPESTEPG